MTTVQNVTIKLTQDQLVSILVRRGGYAPNQALFLAKAARADTATYDRLRNEHFAADAREWAPKR